MEEYTYKKKVIIKIILAKCVYKIVNVTVHTTQNPIFRVILLYTFRLVFPVL